jgi:hypothetical protein
MKTTIEMAIEAGIINSRDAYSKQHVQDVLQKLKAFEALVRADGRLQARAAQPAPVPLTDDQIDVLRESKSKGRGAGWSFDFKGFARAIEQAHGITDRF